MTMITPSYLGETIEYSSLHACRSTLEDPTAFRPPSRDSPCESPAPTPDRRTDRPTNPKGNPHRLRRRPNDPNKRPRPRVHRGLRSRGPWIR